MRLKLILLFLTVWALYAQGQKRDVPSLIVQAGHTNRINAGAVSPDDLLLATGGIDQTIKVWNLNTGKLIDQYPNDDAIYSLAFLPSSNILLSGGYGIQSTPIKVWNLEEGSHAPMASQGGTLSMAINHAENLLAIGTSLGTAALYDLANSGEGLWYYNTGAEESVKSIAFSPDDSLVALGCGGFSEGYGIHVYRTSGPDEVASFKTDAGVLKLLFADRNTLLVEELTYSDLNKVYRIDLQTGERSLVREMSAMAILENGLLVGMTGEYTLSFCSLDGAVVREVPIREKFIDELLTDRSGERLIALGRDMECLEVASGESTWFVEGVSWIEDMSFAPQGNRLAFTSSGGGIINWDLESNELDLWAGHRDAVLDLHFDQEGHYLASVAGDSSIIVWNPDGSVKHRIRVHSDEFHSISMNPSAELLAVSLEDTILVYDVESGAFTEGFSIGGYDVQKVVFSPNNRDIGYLIGSYVLIYDVTDGTYRLQRQIGTASLEDLVFSGDGSYAATSGYSDSLYVFDLDSAGRMFYAMELPDRTYVNSLAMDPGSLRLAVGYSTGIVSVIDIREGVQVAEFREFSNLVNRLSFREDGAVLAGSSWDGKLVLWDMDDYSKMAELYAFDDGTWAVVDADGRYDASNAGSVEHIHFAVGSESISLDQLKERFYEPGLLQKLLGFNAEPLRDVSRLSSVAMYPQTHLEINDGELSLRFLYRDGGLGRVQFFINDKEVIPDLRPQLEEDSLQLSASGSIDLNDFSQYYQPGMENDLAVVVYNAENYLASPRQSIVYRAPQTNPQGNGFSTVTRPKLFAIVVGTANYRGERLDLMYADKDARLFSDALRQSAAALFGPENIEIELFTTDEKDRFPDKERVEQAFRSLRSRARPMDVLVVYFSGHGTTFTESGSSQFHYLTAGVESGDISDQLIRDSYTISSEELTGWINAIPVEKQVLILDACSSGQAIEDILVSSKSVTSGQVRALERLKDRTGMFILTGSASDKVSFEASRFGQSLLTYSLLSGIQGQALREGEFVDVLGLFRHSAEQVPELASYIGGIQKPILAVPYGGQSFDIGRVDETVKIELASIKPVFIRSNFQDEFEYADILGFSDKIDAQFRDLAIRAKSTEVLFVDVSNYPDAYSIKGRYSREGKTVLVTSRVFRDRESIGSFELENDEDSIADLIDELIGRAQEIVRDYESRQ